jgi:rod shape-determining protein MreC
VIEKVMSDETVPAGERVLTSGGDGIFPKGLPVGSVTKVAPGSELFLNIRVRPAANLSKLEEVLVVTKIDERQAEPDQTGAARAVDILTGRLPSVPSKTENAVKVDTSGSAAPTNADADAKPKPTPPKAFAGSGAPPARKAGASSPTASTVNASTNSVPKALPNPVKAVVVPAPQPAAEDGPQ